VEINLFLGEGGFRGVWENIGSPKAALFNQLLN